MAIFPPASTDFLGSHPAIYAINYDWDLNTLEWVRQAHGGGSSGGGGPIQDGVDPTIEATVLDLAASNPLTVAVVDAAGTQITSFGGGVQYTEGDVDPSITGTAAMMEGAGNTLLPIQGTVADGLLVNLGANNDVIVTNTVATSAAGNTAASGSITAVAQAVTITVPPGGGGVGIQITGTWTGQLDFQATLDGVNWEPVNTSNGVNSTNATAANGIFVLAAAGYSQIRARSTAWTSGTAVVTMNGSVGAGPVLLSSPLPQGNNLIGKVGIDQTTPGTTNRVEIANFDVALSTRLNTFGQKTMAASAPVVIASDQTVMTEVTNEVLVEQSFSVIGQVDAWWQQLTDGTNGPVAVKAASTAALATDPALVVRTVQLPAVLGATGGLKVEGILGGISVATTVNNIVEVDQGAGSDITAPWYTAISDEVTGPVAVKAASTAANATDKALVVAISPNNTIAASITGLLIDQGADSEDVQGPMVQGLVSDSRESYISDTVRPLSLTTDGRLRVSSSPADNYIDFFGDLNPYGEVDNFGSPSSLVPADFSAWP